MEASAGLLTQASVACGTANPPWGPRLQFGLEVAGGVMSMFGQDIDAKAAEKAKETKEEAERNKTVNAVNDHTRKAS